MEFLQNGFQQNLKTGAVFLNLTAAYDTVWHTGHLYRLSKSMPNWFTRLGVCCFEIEVSGCTWVTTPVLKDPNVTAFLKVLSLHQFCSTCTPMSCQLHWPKIHLRGRHVDRRRKISNFPVGCMCVSGYTG